MAQAYCQSGLSTTCSRVIGGSHTFELLAQSRAQHHYLISDNLANIPLRDLLPWFAGLYDLTKYKNPNNIQNATNNTFQWLRLSARSRL